jgi:hypothetical protein
MATTKTLGQLLRDRLKELESQEKFDLSKIPLNEYGHVQTKDGYPARILCTDYMYSNAGEQRIVIAYKLHVVECVRFTDSDGLVPVPKKIKIKGWLNVYDENRHACFHPSREEANQMRAYGRVACVPIEMDVNEGDGITKGVK